jgi:hypothetical protein
VTRRSRALGAPLATWTAVVCGGALAGGGAGACGSSPTAGGADASTGDAPAADVAADAPSADAPHVDADGAGASDAPPDVPAIADAAPPMATPAVRNLGGRILSSPRIVTVTFPGDDPALVGRLQLFDDTITSTAWWTAVSAEYCAAGGTPCVGPGVGGGHVVLPAAAASEYTDSLKGGDSTLRALLASSVAGGVLPAPDAQTLYLLYPPAGTRVLLDGNASCAPSSFTGYHDALELTPADGGASVEAAYAVVARCSSTESAATTQASHEIVEAATDPSPENAPAYQITDTAWTAFGPEVADVCAAVDTDLAATESGFAVQRSWSNASAAAGHDPCVPLPAGEVYFNVAPAQGSETIALAAGESATLALYPFADDASAQWQVSAVAANGSPLAFQLAPATATPGAVVALTVTLQSKPALGVDQLYGVVSQSGTTTHAWPMIVQAK